MPQYHRNCVDLSQGFVVKRGVISYPRLFHGGSANRRSGTFSGGFRSTFGIIASDKRSGVEL